MFMCVLCFIDPKTSTFSVLVAVRESASLTKLVRIYILQIESHNKYEILLNSDEILFPETILHRDTCTFSESR